FKGPGEDGIPNVILKQCSAQLMPLLHTCLRAVVEVRYFPKRWRAWRTIVLRKPGWPDFFLFLFLYFISNFMSFGARPYVRQIFYKAPVNRIDLSALSASISTCALQAKPAHGFQKTDCYDMTPCS
ncbi:hypothetical protein JB92DRAFT_2731277, partial [Gautieria morchelliformis]